MPPAYPEGECGNAKAQACEGEFQAYFEPEGRNLQARSRGIGEGRRKRFSRCCPEQGLLVLGRPGAYAARLLEIL